MIITIHPSPNADSRTADKSHKVSFEEFSKSTDMHIKDVSNLMNEVARMVQEAGKKHDWTKKENEEEFYKTFTNVEPGKNFKDSHFYKYHVENERHHLLARVPGDVNLIDVFEYICDCCAAGAARSGEIYDLDISEKVLKKAFDNTVEMIKSKINLVDENNKPKFFK